MARGAWSRSSVWEVLRNPMYTGFQVWNRKARKKGYNRANPPEQWVWSDEPAHAGQPNATTSTARDREWAAEAPTFADVAQLLDRLPILATSLDTAPHAELRALLESLQLEVTLPAGQQCS